MQISVIVPVYKVEPYLDRCVNSLLNQTFRDFELILVDDGSPDNCGRMCDEYARRDDRIRVIHKENGGLSSARNAGLDISQGTFVAFVDSDDWVHPWYLELLHAAAHEFGTDIACCELKPIHSEEEQIQLTEKPKACLKLPEDVYVHSSGKGIRAYMTRLLIRRDLFAQVRFPVGKLYEDAIVTPKIVFQVDQIAFVDAPLYNYYQRLGSIVNSVWRVKNLDALEAFEYNLELFSSRPEGKPFRASLYSLAIQSIKQCHGIEGSDMSALKKKYYLHVLGKTNRKWLTKYEDLVVLSDYERRVLYPLMHPVRYWLGALLAKLGIRSSLR